MRNEYSYSKLSGYLLILLNHNEHGPGNVAHCPNPSNLNTGYTFIQKYIASTKHVVSSEVTVVRHADVAYAQ